MKDMLVYLSGPITPRDGYTFEDNQKSAGVIFLECIKMGIPAFCPQLLPQADGIDYETWMEYDLAMLERSTHVLMLPRWESSPGALRERSYAIQMGKPIIENIIQLRTQYGGDSGVRGDSTRKVRGGNKKQNKLGKERSDERLQQGDSEGVNHTGEQTQD